MQIIVLLLSLCNLSAAFTQGAVSLIDNQHLLTQFMEWTAIHAKDYKSLDEFGFRLEQYAMRDLELMEIKSSQPDATFTVSHNHFSDWTTDEI